jgi:uncharacterized coiled-coil DUF342 family protein
MPTQDELKNAMNASKVKAYDLLANIEYLQNELRNTNNQIRQISDELNKPVEEVPAVTEALQLLNG